MSYLIFNLNILYGYSVSAPKAMHLLFHYIVSIIQYMKCMCLAQLSFPNCDIQLSLSNAPL